MKYPLANNTWDDNEINAINHVIESGQYTMGKFVNQFEKKFATFVNSKYSLMVNSGSSANLLMIAALFYKKDNPLKRGDEVIVPAVSWGTTYFPLYQYGLKLRFIDIDLETLNYDLNQLKAAITKKTKLVMAVNLLGNSNEFDTLFKIINGYKNIIIIEDNCESLGATYNNKQTGTFGLMGSFSTFFSHHISTMEGGVIVTNDDEIYHIILSLRAHGWTRHLPKVNKICNKKKDDFEEEFRFILPGYNVRPTEIQGAIGIEQLKKIPHFINTRRKNALLFQKIMNKKQDYIIQKEIGCSSWFGFSIVLKPQSTLKRKTLINKLNRMGFELRPIVTGNFIKNDVIKYFDYDVPFELKNATYIDINGLFIGNNPHPMENAFIELSKL